MLHVTLVTTIFRLCCTKVNPFFSTSATDRSCPRSSCYTRACVLASFKKERPSGLTIDGVAVVPHVMKQVRADKGAIPFVLSGANVMCPGLTSAGGDMPESLEAGTPVVSAAITTVSCWLTEKLMSELRFCCTGYYGGREGVRDGDWHLDDVHR